MKILKGRRDGININSWLPWTYLVLARMFSSWPATPSHPCRHMVCHTLPRASPLPMDLLNNHPAVLACGVQDERNQDRSAGRVQFGEGKLGRVISSLVGLRPGYLYTVHGSTNGAWACSMRRNWGPIMKTGGSSTNLRLVIPTIQLQAD